MALTQQQEMQLVLALGWSGWVLDSTSTDYNKGVFDHVASIPAALEPFVIEKLAELADVNTKYKAASSRALVRRVGDIEINPEEARSLRIEYSRLLKELSSMTGIPIYNRSGVNIGLVI